MRTFLLALTLAFAGTALAQAREPRSFLFRWENDSFGFLTGKSTDENYTNGLRFDLGSPGEHRWASAVENLYCRTSLCADAAGRTRIVSYGFTHQFYTPARIDINSRRTDRPWAGVMYGSATLRINDDENVQHLIEGQLGILGQAAGAHYLQSRWHQFINYDVQPVGWAKQLRNEPIANIAYSYTRRFPIGSNEHADVLATPGFVLGTLTTYPSASATIRVGRNVRGFPVQIIQGFEGTARPRVEAYLLAGADARYVLNNATLDGGFFLDGPSVTRKPFVHDLRVGGAVRYRSFRLGYTMVQRSAEYSERRSDQTFYSIAVGYEPR
jgi:lipid A 3-O-deacylase